MNDEEMKKLLRESMERAEENDGPARDLWPEVLRRVSGEPAAQAGAFPWLDWALAAGLVIAAAAFPAAIPVFLYYL